ncbi:tetratricopeptide repeat protein [Marinobacter sp. ATCH36]|uniref:tetratricopeptide repeat protein n=1 Tax=Marinobacter sp. ATCH36 TaxID=2945106 RepID=UPI00201FDAA9|nr:tetratricopeptide repeat protein [Marinobacter sp. ATCH36]MCL7942740.1 sel1 repeat family protein [Marinobacter sp. ATCH36]
MLLSGCAGIDGERLSKASSEVVSRTGNAVKAIITGPDEEPYERQRQALFDQPYIDPLTDYLKAHGDDTDRETLLRQIADERDRRCQVIAENYAEEPATEEKLIRYRAGYSYSCPAEVKAFSERVEREQQKEAPSTVVGSDSSKSAEEPEKEHEQDASDCYLLTSIRNYSAAREACREFAENGDPRSQANMALIAHAFEDYASAFKWAQKAAPVSGKASYLLGQMYASGRGVGQNPEQAVYWYDKAASLGHEEARMALKRYREQTPADGI